jgi:hypothetical protein
MNASHEDPRQCVGLPMTIRPSLARVSDIEALSFVDDAEAFRVVFIEERLRLRVVQTMTNLLSRPWKASIGPMLTPYMR